MDTLEVAYRRRPIANTNLRWLLGRFSRFRIRSSPQFLDPDLGHIAMTCSRISPLRRGCG